jgi:hypothetical protein
MNLCPWRLLLRVPVLVAAAAQHAQIAVRAHDTKLASQGYNCPRGSTTATNQIHDHEIALAAAIVFHLISATGRIKPHDPVAIAVDTAIQHIFSNRTLINLCRRVTPLFLCELHAAGLAALVGAVCPFSCGTLGVFFV